MSLHSLLLLGCSLLGSWLLGSLFGSWLLSNLLGSWFLGSWLLGGLLGLLCLLGSSLLCLLWLLNLDNLIGSSSLTRCSGHFEGSLGNSTLEGQTDLDGSLGSINLVVGTDVLEDGLAGRASAVLEGGDGSSDHHGVLGVVSGCLGGLLGFRCFSRHVGVFRVRSSYESPC